MIDPVTVATYFFVLFLIPWFIALLVYAAMKDATGNKEREDYLCDWLKQHLQTCNNREDCKDCMDHVCYADGCKDEVPYGRGTGAF